MRPATFITSANIREELYQAINKLPVLIEQDDPEGGVLRPWVRSLPLRFQGVIVTALRGCDGAPKEDSSKSLSRMIRRAVMNPADPRESLNAGGFFGFSGEHLEASLGDYCHSDNRMAEFFRLAYYLFCHTLHLRPESKDDMTLRLTEDRIANGTTERNF